MNLYFAVPLLSFICVCQTRTESKVQQTNSNLKLTSLTRNNVSDIVFSSLDSHDDEIMLYKNYSNGNASRIFPECDSYVEEYGRYSSKFIKCSVTNARPFRFCEGCVVHYEKSKTVFADLSQNDGTRDDCKRQLLDADRVQVISSIQRDIENIWKSADCENCFNPITEDENGTVLYSLTEKTQEFLNAYSNFSDCVPHVTNVTTNKTVCDVCKPYYRKMNSLFTEFQTANPQHVCMDIVDMMNYTRLLWGGSLNCRNIHHSYKVVIPVSVGLMIIPVVFYVVLGVYGTKRTRKFMKQSRLPLLLSSSNYGTLDSPPLFSEETERQPQNSMQSHDSSIQLGSSSESNQPHDRISGGNGDLLHRKLPQTET